MVQNIILALTLISAFFMSISAYTLGLTHGKQIQKGDIPKIKQIFDISHEEPDKTDEITDEFNKYMSMTKESLLQAIKNEVK